MTEPTITLSHAGLTNDAALRFIREWANHVGAAQVQVIDAGDDERLMREALEAGEVLPVSGGRIYARSHPKDTARTEERTFVATADPRDRGVYNNWQPSSELVPRVRELMQAAAAGKTLYAIPYVMAPEGSPSHRGLSDLSSPIVAWLRCT